MKITLKAEKREQIGRQNDQLRDKKWIPAILYGHDTKNINLKIEFHNFNEAFKNAGQTTLIDLVIVPTTSKEVSGSRSRSIGNDEKEPVKVLIHDIQYHPTSDDVIHIDFYKVNMKEKIKTEVPIKTIGDAPAVKDLEGSLLLNLSEIEIECLPGDLIQEIEVDITPLKTFEDKILVFDLIVPEAIEILNDKEEVVALVNPPRSEEELAELDEAVEENVDDVEVTEEKPAEPSDAEALDGKESEKPSEEQPTEAPAEKPEEKKE
jgi:large subunit ribosomal protein L25